MQDFAEHIWRRFGASVLWDSYEIQAAAGAGAATVSLRTALCWAESMPDEPPDGASSILVTGLETALDVLTADELPALLDRLQRLIRTQSRRWGECGLAFVASGPSRYVVTGQGSLMYIRSDRGSLDLGRGLWGGNHGEIGRLLATRTQPNGKPATIPAGYWLRRVS